MARAARLLFSVASYFLFFLVFLYLVGFVGDLLVPKSIDGPASGAGAGLAIAVNLLLIALFGVQHSVMARPGFKTTLNRAWHPAVERSLYVLITSLVLIILMAFWQPLPALVWSADASWLRTVLWILFGAGWAMVFVTTWLLNHFELFGLQQAWLDFTGKPQPPATFRTPLFYRWIRHPLYTGFLLAFWAIPTMSWGHLLFAAGMTAYILIAIRYEERDLIAYLGEDYVAYRRRVGMLVPGLGKARGERTDDRITP